MGKTLKEIGLVGWQNKNNIDSLCRYFSKSNILHSKHRRKTHNS